MLDEIQHKLTGTQIRYGYIWWDSQKEDLYKKVLPDGEFIVEIAGRQIFRRHVDWSKHRLYIGMGSMKHSFKTNDTVNIKRHSHYLVVITSSNE